MHKDYRTNTKPRFNLRNDQERTRFGINLEEGMYELYSLPGLSHSSHTVEPPLGNAAVTHARAGIALCSASSFRRPAQKNTSECSHSLIRFQIRKYTGSEEVVERAGQLYLKLKSYFLVSSSGKNQSTECYSR